MGNNSETDARRDEYLKWLEFARTDLESAKYLIDAPFDPRPLNIVCYHCQQAAEKAVKALIVYLGNKGGMPKVHDISFLLWQIKDTLSEKRGITVDNVLTAAANSLSKYGTGTRYPGELEPDEQMAAAAISDSEKIMSWVENVIASDTTDFPAENG